MVRQEFDPRERLYSTEAVVLRRSDFGEADRLLTLFTPQRGKIRAIAKGVRRPTSRKAGHLEPLTLCRVLLARGRNLDIITQAEALDIHAALREDLSRLAQAYYLAELADRFVPEGEENLSLYTLLVEGLTALEKAGKLALTLSYYELRMLEGAGFGIELFRCAACRREIEPTINYFSQGAGGILCSGCGPGRADAQEISLDALKALRYLSRNSLAAVQRLHLKEAISSEVQGLLQGYIAYILEREPNSRRFLSQVEA